MSIVRVMVLDAWDEVALPWNADLPVGDLKSQALALARVPAPSGDFLVKVDGAEITDEGLTLAMAGIVADAALIVMRRRRQAVR